MGNFNSKKINHLIKKNNFDLNSKEIEKWPELERFMLHQIFILNKNFKENIIKAVYLTSNSKEYKNLYEKQILN